MNDNKIRYRKIFILLCLTLILFSGSSCKKILAIDNPINVVVSKQVFSNDILATAAMSGLYSNMINQGYVYGVGPTNGFMSIWAGTSADELLFFSPNVNDAQFQDNHLVSSNAEVSSVWQVNYNLIYAANAILGGVASSTGVHDSVKNELIGEAEVVRAFLYFYLVNLFGDVPMPTSTNFEKTALLSKTPSANVYQLIISDLKDANNRLPEDYSVGLGERIVPTKYAAAALLARTYLYLGDWANAYAEADTVISNATLYSLPPLNQVFLANSSETIWQLKLNAATGSTYNVTPEGLQIIPPSYSPQPFVYLAPQLLGAFDSGDQRQVNWLDSTNYSGTTYYFPYKYKAGPDQLAVNGTSTEYYMVLRLGEQLLIRAEAQAHGSGNGPAGAVIDLNAIRLRAGLPAYSGSTDSTVLDSIYHERQVELFAEWGHRWLDLKRTGQSASVLAGLPYKQPWSNNALLYPIPYSELLVDPNLVQNTGY